jgi:ketol-acid reductoisomerase
LIDGTVAILGYGHQGRAQALNLRDAGWRVVVGARDGGAGAARAIADGFAPRPLAAAAAAASAGTPGGAGVFALLLPDDLIPALVRDEIAPAVAPGTTLLLAHGSAIVYGGLVAPAGCDLALVAPAAPGAVVRSAFEAGRGVPTYIAVAPGAADPERARTRATAWAQALGAERPGGTLLETDVESETVIDLFGEQAVVVGGVTELVEAAFATLVEAGYDERVAYLEVVHQLKHLVDVIHAEGPDRLRDRISGTALFGALTRGPRVINAISRAAMVNMLGEIESGAFAAERAADLAAGSPLLASLREATRARGLTEARARALAGRPGPAEGSDPADPSSR